MKNRTYKIDNIEAKFFGNSKIGFTAAFDYIGDDPRKMMAVIKHPANAAGIWFKTIKEVKETADKISCIA